MCSQELHIRTSATLLTQMIIKYTRSTPWMPLFQVSLPDGFCHNYHTDLTFGDIYKFLKGELPADGISKDRVTRISKFFKLEGDLLLYEGMICVPRTNVKEILELAHDNRTSGHFGYSKTLSRLHGYHWKNKSTDVYEYCRGCKTCQLNKDRRTKPLGVPQPLELPTRRWGSVAIDFITHLPRRNLDTTA